MGKILIIEDRIVRQNNYLISFNIDDYEDVVENCVGEKFTKLKEIFGSKVDIDNTLSPYDIVAVHRSAFEMSILDDVIESLKKSKKKMVLFSGGISSSSLVGNVLNINSKDFYSENLKLFCDMLRTPNYHLSVLQFGERWKLSLTLGCREQIIIKFNRFKETGGNVRLEDIELFASISSLIEIPVHPTKTLEMVDYEAVLDSLNQNITSFLN